MHARASSLRASSTPNAAGRMTTARKGSSGRRAATPTRRGGRAVVARAASSQQNVMPANAENKPVAIVTGSSSGLGLYTAKALIKNGYFVVNAVRSPEKMQVKANELGLDESSYAIMYLELGDLQSVRDFATEFRRSKYVKNFQALVCNAALYLPNATVPSYTKDGFEAVSYTHLTLPTKA